MRLSRRKPLIANSSIDHLEMTRKKGTRRLSFLFWCSGEIPSKQKKNPAILREHQPGIARFLEICGNINRV